MEYIKQNFEAGTILTATALNAMDDQIIANANAVDTLNANVTELQNVNTLELAKTYTDEKISEQLTSYLLIETYEAKIAELEAKLTAAEAKLATVEEKITTLESYHTTE